MSTYGIDSKAAAVYMSNIEIIHVHGKISNLPWQDDDGLNIPYGDSDRIFDDRTRPKLIDQLKIVHDEVQRPELVRAKNLLLGARRIYILGFGFDPINCQLLDLNNQNYNYVYATAVGMTSHEIKQFIRSATVAKVLDDTTHISREFLRRVPLS